MAPNVQAETRDIQGGREYAGDRGAKLGGQAVHDLWRGIVTDATAMRNTFRQVRDVSHESSCARWHFIQP
jgi:hypothetical protein